MEADRDAALQRVMELRAAGRARSAPRRAAAAVLGLVALVAAVPLVVVLPELGVPLLLLALRLLAIEFDWAARGYAWVTWRWGQAKRWFRESSPLARVLVVAVLLLLAAGLLWLLAHTLL